MQTRYVLSLLIFLFSLSGNIHAQKPATTQNNQPHFTPALERIKSYDQKKSLTENSLVKNLPFRSVGPTIFGGRISEVAVNPNNPNEFYAAYASGGLWHTKNNGQTLQPLFQNEMVITTGAIAVDWKNDVLWLGTGEVNSSRSSYAGLGMYKSIDGGKTWEHKGLGESHHIGRIVLHPTDPNTLWVAVLGHLYSPNQERGVYKTTDGGATWKKVLFVNADAGAVDLQMDPIDPNTLYASIWERTRRAWNFTEGGEGTGIHKSTDGGETWALMTTEKSDFPKGENIGRIGIDVSKDNGKTILYAIVDNQNRRPKEKKKDDKLVKTDFKKMTKDQFLKLSDDELGDFLKSNGFPKKYSTKVVKNKVKKGDLEPTDFFEYLTSANSQLFETQVVGSEVYRSDDGGATWKKTHEGYLDEVTYSYGYYFGMMRVHPTRPDEIYIAGVPVLKSKDGGKTFENINGENVHVDHHDLWINADLDGHLILGNDGGINISYDDGENWNKIVGPPVGQFYAIAVDDKKPYNIYGGTQDNGVWKGPSTYEASARWQYLGAYDYDFVLGGDGMQIAIDSRDNETVYTGFQFGNYFRINKAKGERKRVTPNHDLGERPLRWNWQTPVQLSKHNQDIFYMGSNKLHRSMDQGDTWTTISDDLTLGGKKGDVPYGTLATIHESDLQFGLIYTGSDDGKIHVTKDGGVSWDDISAGLPEQMWVARVRASVHEKSRVYVALNGYRWDNFRPLIYVSEDYGATWQKIGKDLPLETVNVIKEDPVNPNLLYVGTDHGLYVSLDRGVTFMAFSNGLPNVPVHDVVVQKREKDLVVGTHGRSIYVGDIAPIQAMTDSLMTADLAVFDITSVKYRSNWGGGSKWFKSDPPEVVIPFYAKSAGTTSIAIKAGDLTLKQWSVEAAKGLNYASYDLTFDESQKGRYEKWLAENSKDKSKKVEVKEGKFDKRFYLRKGEYGVEVDKDGTVRREIIVE